MIKAINHFTPPKDATPFNPAKTVSVPAGGTAELTLKGRNADVFGITRILPWAPGNFFDNDKGMIIKMSDLIHVTATLNSEKVLFKDIQLSTLYQLFAQSSLLGPLIVQKNNNIIFTLTNTSDPDTNGRDVDVNIELMGYNGDSLRKLVSLYKSQKMPMPTPLFLYGSGDIKKGAQNQPITVPTKSVDVQLIRGAITPPLTAPGAQMDGVQVSMRIGNKLIKSSVFAKQFNDEFASGERPIVPYNIKKISAFSMEATNGMGFKKTISFLGEAYKMDE